MLYLIGTLVLGFAAGVYAFAIYDKRAASGFTPRPDGGTKNEQMEQLLDAWRTGSEEQKRALEEKFPAFFANRQLVFRCMLLILSLLFIIIVLVTVSLLDQP